MSDYDLLIDFLTNPVGIMILISIVFSIVAPFFTKRLTPEERRALKAKLEAPHFEKMQKRHNQRVHDPGPTRDDQCVACDSTWVDAIADGVYRCNKCGYTGGPGYQAYAAEKQVIALQSKPMHVRRKDALTRLRDTTLMMTALEGNIDAAINSSKLDVSKVADAAGDLDDFGEADKRAELYEIQEETLRINSNIDLVGKLLDEDLSSYRFEPDFGFMLSEVRDRWTKQERGYTVRHERQIHKEIVAMRDDLQHAKVRLRKKMAEIKTQGTRPATQNLQF